MTPSSPEKPPLNTALLVAFSMLMLCAIPVLPIWLWRKGRLNAPVAIGVAVIWVAGYIALGSQVEPPPEPKDTASETKQTEKPEKTSPSPKAEPTTKTTPTPKPTPCFEWSPAPPSAGVDKCQFARGEWPLTVDYGTAVCEPKPNTNVYILTFIAPDPDGTEYALNGIAAGAGYPEIDPIWRDDPDIPGAKVNIGPLMRRATQLC